MLEDRFAQHDKIPGDVYGLIIADYTMTTYDYVIRAAADGPTGPFTITLPPVAEARGRLYSICIRNADPVNTVTIEDNNDDSECWLGDIEWDGKCDAALFYSDGLKWYALGEMAGWPGLSTTAAPGTATPTTAPPTTAAPL